MSMACNLSISSVVGRSKWCSLSYDRTNSPHYHHHHRTCMFLQPDGSQNVSTPGPGPGPRCTTASLNWRQLSDEVRRTSLQGGAEVDPQGGAEVDPAPFTQLPLGRWGGASSREVGREAGVHLPVFRGRVLQDSVLWGGGGFNPVSENPHNVGCWGIGGWARVLVRQYVLHVRRT